MWTLDKAEALAQRGVAIERAYRVALGVAAEIGEWLADPETLAAATEDGILPKLHRMHAKAMADAIGWASIAVSPEEVYRAAWLALDEAVRPSRHAWPLDRWC